MGDFVYKLNSSIKKGVSRKLLPIFDGPFIVTRVISPVLIEIENRKKRSVVHHDKLKHCHDRCIPLWIRRRRQELLSLDDTLPYGDDDESFMDDDILRDLFVDDDTTTTINDDNDHDQMSQSESDSDDSFHSIESDLVDHSPQVTRRGRRIKPNILLKDYVQ